MRHSGLLVFLHLLPPRLCSIFTCMHFWNSKVIIIKLTNLLYKLSFYITVPRFVVWVFPNVMKIAYLFNDALLVRILLHYKKSNINESAYGSCEGNWPHEALLFGLPSSQAVGIYLVFLFSLFVPGFMEIRGGLHLGLFIGGAVRQCYLLCSHGEISKGGKTFSACLNYRKWF